MDTQDLYEKLLQELCAYAVGDLTTRRDVFAPTTAEDADFAHALDEAAQELADQLLPEQRRQFWDIVSRYVQLRQTSEWSGFKAGAALVLRLVGKVQPELLTKLTNTDIIGLLQTR